MNTTTVTHSDVIDVLGDAGFLPVDEPYDVATDQDVLSERMAEVMSERGWEAVKHDGTDGLIFVRWSEDGITMMATTIHAVPTGQATFPFTRQGLDWLAGAISGA